MSPPWSGRRFPGGSYTVARWENVLLHDVVEADPAPGGLVHPIGLFHIPLAACGGPTRRSSASARPSPPRRCAPASTTGRSSSRCARGTPTTCDGEFTDVERKTGRRGGVFDKVTFRLDLTDRDTGAVAAVVTNSWLFLRSGT